MQNFGKPYTSICLYENLVLFWHLLVLMQEGIFHFCDFVKKHSTLNFLVDRNQHILRYNLVFYKKKLYFLIIKSPVQYNSRNSISLIFGFKAQYLSDQYLLLFHFVIAYFTFSTLSRSLVMSNVPIAGVISASFLY